MEYPSTRYKKDPPTEIHTMFQLYSQSYHIPLTLISIQDIWKRKNLRNSEAFCSLVYASCFQEASRAKLCISGPDPFPRSNIASNASDTYSLAFPMA